MSRTRSSRKLSSLDSSIGTTVGVALTLGCILVGYFTVPAINNSSIEEESCMSQFKKLKEPSETLVLRRLINRLWMRYIRTQRDKDTLETIGSSFEDAAVTNTSHHSDLTVSCHCNSILILIRATAHINIIQGETGKWQFPYFCAPETDVQILSGENDLSVYRARDSSHTQTTAHGFCRICGVQLFRAYDCKDKCIEVNANCIEPQSTCVLPLECTTPHRMMADTQSSCDAMRVDAMTRITDPDLKDFIGPSTPSTIISSGIFSQECENNSGADIILDDPSISSLSSPNRRTQLYDVDKIVVDPQPLCFRPVHENNHSAQAMNKTRPNTKSLIKPISTTSKHSIDQMKYFMNKYSSGNA
jgi:hypothetical protein